MSEDVLSPLGLSGPVGSLQRGAVRGVSSEEERSGTP